MRRLRRLGPCALLLAVAGCVPGSSPAFDNDPLFNGPRHPAEWGPRRAPAGPGVRGRSSCRRPPARPARPRSPPPSRPPTPARSASARPRRPSPPPADAGDPWQPSAAPAGATLQQPQPLVGPPPRPVTDADPAPPPPVPPDAYATRLAARPADRPRPVCAAARRADPPRRPVPIAGRAGRPRRLVLYLRRPQARRSGRRSSRRGRRRRRPRLARHPCGHRPDRSRRAMMSPTATQISLVPKLCLGTHFREAPLRVRPGRGRGTDFRGGRPRRGSGTRGSRPDPGGDAKRSFADVRSQAELGNEGETRGTHPDAARLPS